MLQLEKIAPLSFAQERLWFIDAAGGGATYNVPLLLRWTEPVDVPALATALAAVTERHDVLRTTYELCEGSPVQVVRPPGPVPLEVRPARGDWAWVHEEALRVAREPFDLTTAPPVRCVVWQGGPAGDAMLLCAHHIAIDGWSSGPLFAELASAYAAGRAGRVPELDPLPVRYTDFAARDRAAFTEPAVAAHLDRRVGELLRVDGDLALAGRRAVPDAGGGRPGEQHVFTLPAPVWNRVGQLAAEVRATPFVVLFAAFQAVLKRWTERDEFLVGMVAANRSDPEFERLVGFFVNTVPLLCAVPAGVSFRGLCGLARRESFAALTHQRLPYEKLLAAARARGAENLVTVAFGLQNMPAPDYPVPPPWTAPRLLPTGTAKYELLVLFEEDSGELTGTVEVDTGRYPAELAARLAENVTVLLQAALAGPDRPVATLPVTARGAGSDAGSVLCGPERRHDVTTVVDAIAGRLASVDPDAPAVTASGETVTWRELDGWARAIASGLPRDAHYVPVAAARGGGMTAAWLGVLRTGAAYVPLGVDIPPSRAEHILREVGADVVLADAEGVKLLAGLDVTPRVIRIDESRHAPAPPGPPVTPHPESPAVLLYTSGTTGRPKGIMIPHRGLLNTVIWWAEEFGLSTADRVLCTWSTQFDVATFDTFRCLVAGAQLVYADDVERRDPHALVRLIRGPAGATVMSATPSLLRTMLVADEGAPAGSTMRAITAAGEVVTQQIVRACLERWGVPTQNMYGPAEVSCATTGGFVDPDDEHPTIGRPLPNYRCLVLGPEGEDLPEGVPGELYVAGVGVSIGYLAQPGRTATAYVPDPVEPGRRMYRTGDRVAVRPDGRLDYLGRFDHQVKILGNRIEPDEVRALLEEQPGVRSAAVVPEGEPERLVAYVVLSEKDTLPTRDELVTPLLRWLPSPVLPARLYVVDEIPLNTNDKTDFRALRAMRSVPLPAGERTVALTPGERHAAEIMTALLGVDEVLGPDASFFSIGGHSLGAIEIVREAERRHGVVLTLREFLTDPTVAGLGGLLTRTLGDSAAPAPCDGIPAAATPGQRFPATSVQQRLWFIDRVNALRTAYLIPILIELTGPVDHARLRDATAAVLGRHPALRSRFELGPGRRRIHYRTDGPPPEVEITHGTADLAEFCWTSFDLAADAPARARVIADGDRTVLAVVTHHIVFDGWSFDVLFDQIGRAYRNESLPPAVHPVEITPTTGTGAAEVIERLRGAPTDVALPLAGPRREVQPVVASTTSSTVDKDLTGRLRAVAGPLGCSTFVTSAALLAATLARTSRQRDFLIAFPWAGRDRADTTHAVGMFVNTLVLRADLRDEPTWRRLLERVRDDVRACYRTADVPFDEVVAALHPGRDLSRPPLTPVYLGVFDGEHTVPDLGPGTAARYLPLPGTTVKYELDLTVTDQGDELVLTATYPTELWSAATAAGLLASIVDVAADLVADPDAAVLTGVRDE
ncbi:amino acid adenylation domain-containing protein [Actinophytocola sp.]|uniref:non-ribosomal peptide synthetase n=1 Tax=Actinophytocola sp. TaxID=1872138 RepID=UPI003D6AEF7B